MPWFLHRKLAEAHQEDGLDHLPQELVDLVLAAAKIATCRIGLKYNLSFQSRFTEIRIASVELRVKSHNWL